MDFTALELGLRNRQLLQVKCFLKIQIETFRYVLKEELNQTGYNVNHLTALEKFFLQDWQNVVNKIYSVATIQMNGDYSSKIFAILLYRSLIHSCNQLILIVFPLFEKNPTDVFIPMDQIGSIQSSRSLNNQLGVVKEKILMLLIEQINSMRENLSRIYRSELNLYSASLDQCHLLAEQTNKSFDIDLFCIEDIEQKIKIGKFQELFEHFLIDESIPLFQWLMKKYSQDANVIDQLMWENIIERIVNFTSTKIQSNDIDMKMIEQINSYLVQTGLPTFDLLYSLFIQTCDGAIRQKLLYILSTFFNEESISKIINTTDNYERCKSNFGYYYRIISIIDMYIFSQRSKINDDEKLEISIEWLHEKNSDIALSKSFILPVLDEITLRPDFFIDWQELTANIYNHIIYDQFRKFIFVEENFNSYITAEILWQYLIDNNKKKSLITWIEKDYFTVPYCSEIKPNDLETCHRMIQYLLHRSPLMLKYEIFTVLISNPYFFNQHDFSDLAMKIFTFQNFLTLIGRTDLFSQEKDVQKYFILEKLLNKVIKLLPLVEYCIEHELFEFIFLLYNQYKIDFDVFFSSTNIQFENTKTLDVLTFLHGLCFQTSDEMKNVVFEKSFFILRFLNGNLKNRKFSFKENTVFILNMLSSKMIDLDLILFILSFSQTETFDDFVAVLKELCNESESIDLVKLFLNNLTTKYPLIYQALNINSIELDCSESLKFSNKILYSPQQAFTYNIYTCLQQAIPFVNINKVFQWQINKNKKQQLSTFQSDLIKNQIGNNELPHFSQKRLTEFYGLKSNLTASYYLKNLRLIEAFLTFNNIRLSSNKNLKSRETRSTILNEKSAIKIIRRASTIGYNSIKNDSIITSSLLFQYLIKSCLSSNKSKATINDTFRKNVSNECEKFRLHLTLGRLIIEYAADFLTLQETQQQNVLASLLRRSHFNSDRNCSQKLLDLGTIAIERKYSVAKSSSCKSFKRKTSIDFKLISLFIESSLEIDQSLISTIQSCPLLMECFDWKPLFIFSNFYSLHKPLNFLNKCTSEDNWLMFVIFAQLYEIPKDEIQSLLSQTDFNNQCEHLAKAFQSSRHVNVTNLTETDSKLLKTKQPPNSSRNILYSKLFKDKSPYQMSAESTSQSPPSPSSDPKRATFLIENESPENMSLYSLSLLSKISEENISNTYVLYEQLNPQNSSKDFLQLILDIYQNCVSHYHRLGLSFCIETSFQMTLLYASVSLSNPVLTLLACSLEKTHIQKTDTKFSSDSPNLLQQTKRANNWQNVTFNFDRFKYPSFACWLLASVDQHSKRSYIDWYCQTNSINPNDSLVDCFTNWSPDRLLRLISILTANNAENFQMILQGFQMFEIKIPILYVLLDFLIGFLVMKDYYQTSDLLLQFQSLLLEYNEDEFVRSQGISLCDQSENFISDESDWLISDFYSRSWIEKCSLIIITNSLLIAKQFELSILLSHYNFVRIQDSFSSDIHRIPDIRKFYLFSQCLNKVTNYTLPISELLLIETNADELESRYGDVLREIIFDLQESGHFDTARNIINLLSGANTNEFIINEWMLKAKKAELDKDSTSIYIDISFWQNCWSQVSKLDPSMQSAFKVMERFVQQLETSQILIKCFVLLKCLLAVETILKDSIAHDNDLISPCIQDFDSSTICSSDGFNNSELIHDYFNFEVSLWKSVVECEFYIQTTFSNECEQQNEQFSDSRNEKNFVSAWEDIWKDIVSYFNSSTISKTIMPKLNEKYPYLYKNVQNQRSKQTILLEVFKHKALNQVIRNLLDYFCYQKAQEVSKLFNYVHDDFEIIHACDKTARGIMKDISDAPLSVQLKMKHSDSLSSSFINSKANISTCNWNPEQKKIISMIETFLSFATIGQKFCEYILLHYKIACFLGKNYSDLIDFKYTSDKLLSMLFSSSQIENETQPYEMRSEDDGISDQLNLNHASLIDKYMETILCAKEFIRIVGKVDNKLDSESKIVDLLAHFVFQDVQQIVDQQFQQMAVMNFLSINQFNELFKNQYMNIEDLPQTNDQNTPFTEIELDRTQLEFNSARFLILIRLLREPYLLGHKLLELCKKSKTAFENTWNDFNNSMFSCDVTKIDSSKEIHFMVVKRKHYVQMVELYIRAHECYTAQCDVGGIALVLRKTRILITQELQPARYFHLILRLLTGIGRYSEMTYCFDLFRECDRFELILSKRVQRTPQLRIALLNYLKNAEHIDELLPLVALRFFLYRETADQHRTHAEKLLNELNFTNLNLLLKSNNSGKSLSKKMSSNSLSENVSHSPPTFNISPSSLNVTNWNTMKEQLETIMYEFQEAEINYTKAASYANADYCSRKAQLVALQLFYLNKSKCNETVTNISTMITIVINLDSNQVKDFINQCNNFYEALIVSKSYSEVNIEWADPFFNNAIINNNVKYVSQFLEINEISISFLEKLIKRFELFSTLFRQQNSKIQLNREQAINSSSPLPVSFVASVSQIRSEMELQKIYLILEQIMESILCDETMSSSNINLIDKYRFAKKLNSPKIVRRLMENNYENSAYVLDLKSNKNL